MSMESTDMMSGVGQSRRCVASDLIASKEHYFAEKHIQGIGIAAKRSLMCFNAILLSRSSCLSSGSQALNAVSRPHHSLLSSSLCCRLPAPVSSTASAHSDSDKLCVAFTLTSVAVI